MNDRARCSRSGCERKKKASGFTCPRRLQAVKNDWLSAEKEGFEPSIGLYSL